MAKRDIEERLNGLRNSWQFWNTEANGESGFSPVFIHNAMRTIEAEAADLKQELIECASFETIGAQLVKGDDRDPLELAIVKLIRGVSENLNIANNITVSQAAECAIDIVENFKGLSLEEIGLCFYRAKRGEYGEIMHRLDGNVIMGWLRNFEKERSAVVEDMQRTFHESSKRAEMDGKNCAYDMGKFYKVLPTSMNPDKKMYEVSANAGEAFFRGNDLMGE